MNIEGLEITHPDKLFFPEAGITKAQLVAYYHKIAVNMLPFLKDRPVTLQRFPRGIGQPGFFQKHAQAYFPEFIERIVVKTKEGEAEEIMVNNIRSLIYLVNQSAVTFHTWLSRKDHLYTPDKVIFDLDPFQNDFARLREGAQIVRRFLAGRNIESKLMTTGKKGLHIYYTIEPNHTFDEVRSELRTWAEELAVSNRELFTLEIRKKKRGDKIYLDILRNAYAQTGVCPYSLRPNESAGVATPVEWDELGQITSGSHFTIQNIFSRLDI